MSTCWCSGNQSFTAVSTDALSSFVVLRGIAPCWWGCVFMIALILNRIAVLEPRCILVIRWCLCALYVTVQVCPSCNLYSPHTPLIVAFPVHCVLWYTTGVMDLVALGWGQVRLRNAQNITELGLWKSVGQGLGAMSLVQKMTIREKISIAGLNCA